MTNWLISFFEMYINHPWVYVSACLLSYVAFYLIIEKSEKLIFYAIWMLLSVYGIPIIIATGIVVELPFGTCFSLTENVSIKKLRNRSLDELNEKIKFAKQYQSQNLDFLLDEKIEVEVENYKTTEYMVLSHQDRTYITLSADNEIEGKRFGGIPEDVKNISFHECSQKINDLVKNN